MARAAYRGPSVCNPFRQKESIMSAYQVVIASCENTDFPAGSSGHGENIAPRFEHVPSIEAGRDRCMGFIRENSMGGGNWGNPAGGIYAVNARGQLGRLVARVSYNGRIVPVESGA